MKYAYFISFHTNTGIIFPLGVTICKPNKFLISEMVVDLKQVSGNFEVLMQVGDVLASVWLDKPVKKIGLITITKLKVYEG